QLADVPAAPGQDDGRGQGRRESRVGRPDAGSQHPDEGPDADPRRCPAAGQPLQAEAGCNQAHRTPDHHHPARGARRQSGEMDHRRVSRQAESVAQAPAARPAGLAREFEPAPALTRPVPINGLTGLLDRSENRNATSERGFTFLVVIWALSMLVVLSLVFGASVSAHFKATRNAMDSARAEALGDAGIQLAVLDLSAWRARTGREARFPRNGRPVGCNLGNGDWLSIAIEDEVGKVDLNTADERLIGAALLAAGVAEDDVPRHAQRILDYRDADNDRRPLGAEIEEYRAQGRAGPKNQPFDAIEEVEQVLGIPLGLADALRPYVTVYSGQVTIDGNLAQRRLLAALSGRRG